MHCPSADGVRIGVDSKMPEIGNNQNDVSNNAIEIVAGRTGRTDIFVFPLASSIDETLKYFDRRP